MNENSYIPESFIKKVKEIIPEHLNLDDFIRSCRQPLRRSIRVNTLKISCAAFIDKVKCKGWQLSPIPWCTEGYWLERPKEEEAILQLGNTEEHLAGLFYVQEASSMLPPFAMLTNGSLDAETVLDVASAPGSKTTQLAAYMNNNGFIVANELSASRVKVLYSNIERCGVKNIGLTHFDGRVFGDYMPESFDAILLDAPCSGEGTIRKDPDALKNWNQAHLDEVAVLQKELIISAFKALKPNGVLIYSTCTLNLEENQQVCQHLKTTYPELVELESLQNMFTDASKATTPEGFLHIWPQIFDSEGFFAARIRKTGSLEDNRPTKKKLGKFPFEPAKEKQTNALATYFNNQFGLNLTDELGKVMIRDNEYWLFPHAALPHIEKVKYQRVGIKLADEHKKGFRTHHQVAITFGKHFIKNIYQLNADQAVNYFKGQDVQLNDLVPDTGEVLLMLNNAPIGLGKWQKRKIKNTLPRELVKNSRVIQ
ncbi:16S rRNA (cytosine(1407)-C(5))-methyltransferase RsmF [Flocculibacter collagenilyticus]|uniref:16S rRNA (cytosine(1407)-C(5))-methyltransferase RsmF n=1 Tax=Flocculibacter collagenilyticus TaxID=2744479 RepID=UPI0018F4B91E|nr:16S rRNA (cytosine(1407)-C(5))-methyltransferase RsmF [Flocculibacter collagenilyticus]